MIVAIEPSETHPIPIATFLSVVGVTCHSISSLGVSDTYVLEVDLYGKHEMTQGFSETRLETGWLQL